MGIPLIFSQYYKGNHWQGKNVVEHKDSYMFTHQNRKLTNSFEGHIANLDNEMIICMGAGSISNWIKEIGNKLK